jgi:hypothetical protein
MAEAALVAATFAPVAALIAFRWYLDVKRTDAREGREHAEKLAALKARETTEGLLTLPSVVHELERRVRQLELTARR